MVNLILDTMSLWFEGTHNLIQETINDDLKNILDMGYDPNV